MERDLWIYDTAIGEYNGRNAIWIWGIDEDGNYYLIIEPEYKDYFYYDLSHSSSESIMRLLSSELGSISRRLNLYEKPKKLFGRDKEFLVIKGDFEIVKKASNIIKSKYGEESIYEDDIRPSQKYIMDHDLIPCQWHNVKYKELETRENVEIGILDDIKLIRGEKEYPELRILSIEAILGSRYGAPDPDINPILGLILFDGSNYYELLKEESDRRLIEGFEEIINDYDPHIIVGFGSNTLLWPYISERGERLSYIPRVGKFSAEPHQSVLGHFSIGGRINIDLKEYVDDIPIFQRKTLEELSQYLKLETYPEYIDKYLYYQYWENSREELLDYIRWRVKTIYYSLNNLLDHIFALSGITGIPPDYVLTASSGRQAEFFIMRVARKRGEVVPKVKPRPYKPYPGGLVLKPKKGLQTDIAVIDYKSMYPSLMIKYNISPETVTSSREGDIIFFEEIGYGIRRDQKGLLPSILEELISRRDEIRKVMKEVKDSHSRVYKILDARQRVLKILANTMYGYMAWLGARWYSYEGASVVTYLGRRTITLSIDKAASLKLDVVYGDTDSLFVKYMPDKVRELLNWISEELGLAAKIDKIFKKVLFTEAKKRYAGLTTNDQIEIVGLEYVRRDWCDYARNAQYKILKEMLKGASKDRLLDMFREYVKELRRKAVDIKKLIIWEQITKPLEDYKVNAPHLEVAKKLVQEGWKVKRGIFIGYIIHKGEGPLYKRAVHYTRADPKLIDWDYYIYNQLLPVVARILSPIGISEKTLESIARSGGMGLDMFV